MGGLDSFDLVSGRASKCIGNHMLGNIVWWVASSMCVCLPVSPVLLSFFVSESPLDFVGFASWFMLTLFVSILVPMVSACRSGVSSMVKSIKIFWVAVPGNVFIYL